VRKWHEDLKKYADPNCVLMLVGNKSDLEHDRAVSLKEAEDYASKNQAQFVFCQFD